nr:CBS domain-containing protein [Anaerolineae bacterium]
GRDIDVMQAVTVEEVMTHDVETVPVDMTLVELSEVFSHSRHHGYPVLDREGHLWGIVTITDLDRAVANKKPRSTTVAEMGTPRQRLLMAYPDEHMDEVLARMGPRGLGRMPVVSRQDPSVLVGMIRREDIIRAYHIALARRGEIQHRAARMQAKSEKGTEFVELILEESDAAVGRSLRELASLLPNDCIVVSIKRGGRVMIPHGNTIFQAGDLVTAFIHSAASEKVHQCLHGCTREDKKPSLA